MTLAQLLSTLDSNKILASIYDSDETTLISEINTSTYASLDDALEARTIKKWSIQVGSSIKIILNEAG